MSKIFNVKNIQMSIIFKRQKYSIYLNGRRMPFGQLVIGAPGAGKTTYCAGKL